MKPSTVFVVIVVVAVVGTMAFAERGVSISRRDNLRNLGCNSITSWSDNLSVTAKWAVNSSGSNTSPTIRDAAVQDGPGRPGAVCRSGVSGASVPCGPSLTSTMVYIPDYTQPGATTLAQSYLVDGGLKRQSFWIKCITDGGCGRQKPPVNAGGTQVFSYSDNVTTNNSCLSTAAGWEADSDLGIWTYCDDIITVNANARFVVLGATSAATGYPSPTFSYGTYLITGVNVRATDAAVTDTTAYTCIN